MSNRNDEEHQELLLSLLYDQQLPWKRLSMCLFMVTGTAFFGPFWAPTPPCISLVTQSKNMSVHSKTSANMCSRPERKTWYLMCRYPMHRSLSGPSQSFKTQKNQIWGFFLQILFILMNDTCIWNPYKIIKSHCHWEKKVQTCSELVIDYFES